MILSVFMTHMVGTADARVLVALRVDCDDFGTAVNARREPPGVMPRRFVQRLQYVRRATRRGAAGSSVLHRAAPREWFE
jgi:hypothetical protein